MKTSRDFRSFLHTDMVAPRRAKVLVPFFRGDQVPSKPGVLRLVQGPSLLPSALQDQQPWGGGGGWGVGGEWRVVTFITIFPIVEMINVQLQFHDPIVLLDN